MTTASTLAGDEHTFDADDRTRANMLDAVDTYRERGHYPIPLPAGQKKPPPADVTGRDGYEPHDRHYREWRRDKRWGNLALALQPGVVGIDLDLYKHLPTCEKCAEATRGLGPSAARAMVLKLHDLPPLPATWWSGSRDDGSGVLLFRVAEDVELVTVLPDGLGEVIQWFHRYMVAWPSTHPDTGRMYHWRDENDDDADIPAVGELPDLPGAWLELLRAPERGDRKANGYSGSVDDWFDALPDEPITKPMQKKLDALLTELTSGGSRHDAMVTAIATLVSLGGYGHRGVREALNTYIDEFIALVDGDREAGEAEREVDRALEGAIKKFGGNPGMWAGRRVKLPGQAQQHDFWGSHRQLRYIREVATQQLVPPWALLGAVLAQVVAVSDYRILLPDIICDFAAPNLFVGVVGPSGEGKSGPMSLARRLVDRDVTTCPIGTGEGLTAAYVHYERGRVIQHNRNALIDVPEISSLASLTDRRGTTLLGEVLKAFMGELIGFQNRSAETRLIVQPRAYRMALVAGVQPAMSKVLVGNLGAGLPQRFLFVTGTDPDLEPDEPAVRPPRIPIRPLEVSSFTDGGDYIIDVCQPAAWQIRQASRDRMRGVTDAIDGHRLIVQEKTAWALGQITGGSALELREEDWHRAAVMMEVSDAAYARMLDALQDTSRQGNVMRAQNEAEREIIKSDTVREHAVSRVATTIPNKLKEHGPLTRAPLRKKIAKRDREYFDDALAQVIKDGTVTEDGGRYYV